MVDFGVEFNDVAGVVEVVLSRSLVLKSKSITKDDLQ